jgi:hypothetical protein
MATITFDTQEAVIKLKAVDVSQDSLVTKTDLEMALTPIKTDLAVLKADAVTQKWMMGVLIAGVMSIVIKSFF